jgi:hypothetical protein
MITLELSEFEFEELLRFFNSSHTTVDSSGNPVQVSLHADSYILQRHMEELYYQWTRYGAIPHKEIPSTGKVVSNQGRVRSDNVAPISCDGLLFRSNEEILLYKALKACGVSFAPLPVFIRGGNDYQRIEPDFVILKHGIVMIVELDGDTVHKETPAEAHARTKMLAYEGAHIERVKASECDTPEKAQLCVEHLLQVIEKLKALR